MGIERFFTGIVRKDTNLGRAEKDHLPKNLHHLLIDLNGLIHVVAGEVYGYTGEIGPRKRQIKENNEIARKIMEKMSEKERLPYFIKKFKEALKKEVRRLAPLLTLVIAVDGVANAAKMQQQKSRRFLSGAGGNPSPYFDPIVITPGTDFMFKLNEEIESWIVENRDILPRRVIYSSHLVPGEGEHKIFEYIRTGKLFNVNDLSEREDRELFGSGEYSKEGGKTAIHGKDADLIVLSMIAPINDIIIIRDDVRGYFDIEEAKEEFYVSLAFDRDNDKLKTLYDASILFFFLGNDFLPKLPTFIKTEETREIFFEIYRYNKLHLSQINDGVVTINWKNFLELLKEYYNRLPQILEKLLSTEIKYPYPEIKKAFKIVSRTDKGTQYHLDFDLFERLWYEKSFKPHNEDLQEIIEEHKSKKRYTLSKFYTDEDIFKMGIQYLKVSNWVMKYYTSGLNTVNNKILYPYHYAPTVRVMIDVIEAYIEEESSPLDDISSFEEEDEITCIHQLLAVLHPRHISLLPSQFQTIYQKYLYGQNPLKFIIKQEGTDLDYHKTAIIPPVNIDFISYIVLKVAEGVPKKYHNRTDMVINKTFNIVKYSRKKPSDNNFEGDIPMKSFGKKSILSMDKSQKFDRSQKNSTKFDRTTEKGKYYINRKVFAI